MPITQDRVLSLLAAAKDYKQALEQYWIIAQSTRQRVAAGQITAQQGFDLLAIQTEPQWLLQFPYDSPAVIKLEELHFKRESKRNKRKAEKARENRAADLAGEPRPVRGDGREFGKLGSGRTRLDQILDIKPDSNILLKQSTVTIQQPPKPTKVEIISQSTDSEQIQSDTELILDDESKSSILDFINKQDEDKAGGK